MTSDAAAKQWDDNIKRRLFDLVHSQANYEKLGGIMAIGECIATVAGLTLGADATFSQLWFCCHPLFRETTQIIFSMQMVKAISNRSETCFDSSIM
jgi:hypothetical protein